MYRPVDPRRYAVDIDGSDSGWEFMGTWISAVESELYPFDHDVVRAIRRDLDPLFVPLVRRTVFRSPSGADFVWQHHVWARVVEVPQTALGARHAKGVLWPTSPGDVNYGFAKYADRLYVQHYLDDHRAGDSMAMPGRIFPIGWALYPVVEGLMGIARAVSQREQAQRIHDRSVEADIKAKEEVMDAEYHQIRSNRHLLDPKVAVPINYGDNAA